MPAAEQSRDPSGTAGRATARRAAPAPAPAAAARPPAPADWGSLTESVVVPRLIATAVARAPREAEGLVRAAGLPAVLQAPETARVPSAGTYRLWGTVLARSGCARAGLLAAAGYRPGRLDLLDYLLSTAPTLGEGLAREAAHVHLVSTNSTLTVEESGDEVTVTYSVLRGDDELRAVVAEFALGVITAQLRYATGTALSPLRVSFTHRAPRRTDVYEDAFGAARLEFGAPADSITLHRRDLERPLPAADPALAAIIGRAAAAAAPAPPYTELPVPGLREAIIEQLPDGRPSLAEAARRLTVSTRTLQRRLAEAGTTWRAELDAVRREQSAALRRERAGAQTRAARLGFAESRSLRRAMSRWDARDRRPAGADYISEVPGTGAGERSEAS
ncbi:AraC family transcriptional regulator ligand-binding domain-containing protein [Streptomyces sp. HPF1205]|uniref:AraC family transcriptional regulator ligand-binding domain-containing protein n=1 Tax=Streptomyces sp. HPF1205 TaxID=2873262 RepID=UPI001CEDF48F|nr:AraC family transcriptional regulator ligand-binding domain-containing protein [Streptomyces sp. HPF1205]